LTNKQNQNGKTQQNKHQRNTNGGRKFGIQESGFADTLFLAHEFY
jgi:hypothetical protein